MTLFAALSFFAFFAVFAVFAVKKNITSPK